MILLQKNGYRMIKLAMRTMLKIKKISKTLGKFQWIEELKNVKVCLKILVYLQVRQVKLLDP